VRRCKEHADIDVAARPAGPSSLRSEEIHGRHFSAIAEGVDDALL
jgi:hypothetical protein